MTKDVILKTVQGLITEGQSVITSKFDAGMKGMTYLGGRPTGVDLQSFSKWQASCKNLVRLLGDYAEPWKETFEGNNSATNATKMLGTLEAIEQSVIEGLLVAVEDMVRAESFTSLLDQAEFLEDKGYFLAAGTLGRAVLEEHLRSWVQNLTLPLLKKSRPTLNDYKNALYKAKAFTLTVMKHIESMAAVGNDAAHNNPSLDADAIKRLLRDVREFIAKHP